MKKYLLKTLCSIVVILMMISLAACTNEQKTINKEPVLFQNSDISSSIINLSTGKELVLTNDLTCKDISILDNFLGFDDYDYFEEKYIKVDAEPNRATMRTLRTEDEDHLFAIAVFNDSDAPKEFDKTNICFIQYTGSDAFSVCGVRMEMTKDEVIEALGTPSCEATVEEDGTSTVEYHLKKDACKYILSIFFDEDGHVFEVEINIGNRPLI